MRTVFGNAAQMGGFNMETVVPARYLPELLMAAPVWFITSRGGGAVGERGVHYFCDRVASDRFAYLFQIYNYRLRSFEDFQGRDVMPLPILNLVTKVRQLFDYLVIATPYHDIAAREWRESSERQVPPWTRNIDPFLFGFLEQIPELMFFLGRWSGTGMFPLVGDMIADTIQHVKTNMDLLARFNRSRWYKEDEDSREWRGLAYFGGPRFRPIEEYKPAMTWLPRSKSGDEKWRRENHRLIRFANYIIQKFESGRLFSWLRGESR